MKTANILVVDDEPDNFDVIDALLSVAAVAEGDTGSNLPSAYRVSYAKDGPSAIEALEIFQPDLMLLDVMMPGMTGIEVCQRIKAMPRWRPVPIVMVTALTAKADLARCLQAGADDFVSKPVNGLELRARVQSMLRIKHQYEDLQALMKLREDMVNMLVHDLRNPLTSLVLDLDLLTYPNYPPARQTEKLTHMQGAVQTLQLMIDDMLKLAQLEAGQLVLNREAVDMGELVQTAVANFTAIASQKDQRLTCQLSEMGTDAFAIDRVLMHRTLDNLISNAIKFSPAGSEIVISLASATPAGVRIQVIDAGVGIPEELRHQIFEKYQVGQQRLNVAQTGLGLAFCKLVVEAHQGSLCVKPRQPSGSIFEITLGPGTTAVAA
ncbi:MAG: hybrid sensor histidine kinase/response regulator [Cyanobacteria bacterium P01_D01_bin.14]